MNDEQRRILEKSYVQELLAQPLLARLGTCNPASQQPHVTPVWFTWDGESLLISAFSSTRKVREIERNRRVSILVDTGNPGEEIKAVLFEGQAELLSDPALVAPLAEQIYTRYLGEQGVREPGPSSWITDPENRIIRLKPEKIYAWGE
jgi:PPOX class probable F420-dependent enzyme